MALQSDFDKDLRRAISHFWSTRKQQAKKQGAKTGSRDAGARTAVTGGRQMDGFVNLVRDHLAANGIPRTQGLLSQEDRASGVVPPRETMGFTHRQKRRAVRWDRV